MKDHWKTSKDKLVGAEEGSIRSGEIPSDSKSTRKSNVCKQLIQCVKLILYLELVLFVGWGCYSLWQIYPVESMDFKVVDSIPEAESQNLLGQHSIYDRTSTAATSRESDDDVTRQAKNVFHAETARPEEISEVDESTVAGEAVTTTENYEASEEHTESTTNNVATDPVITIVNPDSTEEFDKQSETATNLTESAEILEELERKEEFIENYLLLSLMLRNAWVPHDVPPYDGSANKWYSFDNDSHDEKSTDDVDEKSEARLTSAQEHTVYDDIVISDEPSRWVHDLTFKTNDNHDKISDSVPDLEEVKESDESSKWTFPDDLILNTNDRLDLYRDRNSDSVLSIAEVKESDESSEWAFPDDSRLNTNDRLDLNHDRMSDSVPSLEEVKESANKEKSNERSLGFEPYDMNDYGIRIATDYYDQYMADGNESYENKETVIDSTEQKRISSLLSLIDPINFGFRSILKLTNIDGEKNENDGVQIPSYATEVNYPDSEASSRQTYDAWDLKFK